MIAEEQAKRAQRSIAAFEACQGIPTETLRGIAALPVTERPAALAQAAAKQAKRVRG